MSYVDVEYGGGGEKIDGTRTATMFTGSVNPSTAYTDYTFANDYKYVIGKWSWIRTEGSGVSGNVATEADLSSGEFAVNQILTTGSSGKYIAYFILRNVKSGDKIKFENQSTSGGSGSYELFAAN